MSPRPPLMRKTFDRPRTRSRRGVVRASRHVGLVASAVLAAMALASLVGCATTGGTSRPPADTQPYLPAVYDQRLVYSTFLEHNAGVASTVVLRSGEPAAIEPYRVLAALVLLYPEKNIYRVAYPMLLFPDPEAVEMLLAPGGGVSDAVWWTVSRKYRDWVTYEWERSTKKLTVYRDVVSGPVFSMRFPKAAAVKGEFYSSSSLGFPYAASGITPAILADVASGMREPPTLSEEYQGTRRSP